MVQTRKAKARHVLGARGPAVAQILEMRDDIRKQSKAAQRLEKLLVIGKRFLRSQWPHRATRTDQRGVVKLVMQRVSEGKRENARGPREA